MLANNARATASRTIKSSFSRLPLSSSSTSIIRIRTPISSSQSSFSSAGSSRQFSAHAAEPETWPGPNPIKEIGVATLLGIFLGLFWKKWQIDDKAARIEFYHEYAKAVKAETAAEAANEAAAGEEEEEENNEE